MRSSAQDQRKAAFLHRFHQNNRSCLVDGVIISFYGTENYRDVGKNG